MRRFQILILISAIFLAASFLYAQFDYQQLGWQEFPTAAVDNLFIPYSNPSLLSTGNASGIGMVRMLDNEKIANRYWLMLNFDGVGYAYERNHGNSYHMFAMGTELLPANILPNLYAGVNYRFKEGDFEDGVFRSAFTYRPANFASLAFTWDNPMHESPLYRAGLALRPFAFSPQIADYRLELSVDMNYSKAFSEDYEFQKPIIGLGTQVLDGLKISGMYNLEEETTLISFSLSPRKAEIGSLARIKDNDNYGYVYAHITPQSFKPLFGISKPTWYQMPADKKLVAYRSPRLEIGPIKIFDKNTKNIDEVIKELEKAGNDPTIEGILMINPSFSSSLPLKEELITAFDEFRARGKYVSLYFDNISSSEYIMAAAIADKIYLNPMGDIDLKGIAITSPYLKELLDTIGIEVLNFKSHQYKNAGNMFSESEMTPSEREAYESLLNSIFDNMVSLVGRRSDKIRKPVRDAILDGPYFSAQEALDIGLVDEIIYQDQLDDKLREDFSFAKRTRSLEDYRSYDWAKPKESYIAVIYASGNIVMGKDKAGNKIAQDTTVDLIRKVRKDPKYKGIILRVDSGGGSAQASDNILRELKLAQTENKLPVVVSMAGAAASGGYYISANADRIVAEPTTITGSIGVIGMAFTATELMDKINVNWSTVKIGERSDMFSLTRPWTEDEKELVTNSVSSTYNNFVRIVAEGRKDLSIEDVHEIAQGRVWTGEQALANGLVDDLGGMETAVEHMRELTGIQGEIRLIDVTSDKSDFSINIESEPFLSFMKLEAFEALNMKYIQTYEFWKDFQNDKTLMLSPIMISDIIY